MRVYVNSTLVTYPSADFRGKKIENTGPIKKPIFHYKLISEHM